MTGSWKIPPSERDEPQPKRWTAGDYAMSTFLVLAGFILLLPGLCAIATFLIVNGELWRTDWQTLGLAFALWGVCFLISFGGLKLIMMAFKKK